MENLIEWVEVTSEEKSISFKIVENEEGVFEISFLCGYKSFVFHADTLIDQEK